MLTLFVIAVILVALFGIRAVAILTVGAVGIACCVAVIGFAAILGRP